MECGLVQRKRYCDPVPNTVLAIGGCDKPGECTHPTGRMDVFGVLQQIWSDGTALVLPRSGAATAQIDGNLGFGPRVYITGGKLTTVTGTDWIVTNTTEILVTHLTGTDAGGWTAGPSLNVARWGHAAAAMGGKIFVVGGCPNSGTNMDVCEQPLGSVEVLDPILGIWELQVGFDPLLLTFTSLPCFCITFCSRVPHLSFPTVWTHRQRTMPRRRR